MKRFLIILATILTTVPLCAQKTLENDEIIATIGVNTPYVQEHGKRCGRRTALWTLLS